MMYRYLLCTFSILVWFGSGCSGSNESRGHSAAGAANGGGVSASGAPSKGSGGSHSSGFGGSISKGSGGANAAGAIGTTAGRAGAGEAWGDGEGGSGRTSQTFADVAKACVPACETDADCRTANFMYWCHPQLKRCMGSSYCDTPEDCLAGRSIWIIACETARDCSDPQAQTCVTRTLDGKGPGVCANLASTGCLPFEKVITAREFNGSNSVEVCATNEELKCVAHSCGDVRATGTCTEAFCKGRGHCSADGTRCECDLDSECTASRVSQCNPNTRTCECGSAFDCRLGWPFAKAEPSCQ